MAGEGERMLDNRGLLFTVVPLALIGVLLLFAYSSTIKPVRVELASINDEHLGRIITTNGTVSWARTLSDGSVSFGICDIVSSSEITVYFPSNAYESWVGNLTPGTVIEVTGEVLMYQDEMEISVASSRDVIVISAPAGIQYGLWTIMDSIEMFDGMTVRTNGSMLDIAVIRSGGELVGTGFTLYQRHENQSYSMECMAFGADLTGGYGEWDTVSVTGRVSYYSNKGCWQIVVDAVAPEA